MKKLLLLFFIMLPMLLFSAVPRCLDGTVISLIGENGKVIKTGKLDKQGKLTLNGIKDTVWDIKLTNNGKSIVLGVNNTKGKRGSPLYESESTVTANPLYNVKMSEVKGGGEFMRSSHEAAHVVQQKGGVNTKANINTSRFNKKSQRLDTDSDDDGLSDSCDDANISVVSRGDGIVEIHITILK